MLAVVNAAVGSSWRAGFLTGIGIAVGNMIWAIAAMAGISMLFEVFPSALMILRLLGGSYLIWLGRLAFEFLKQVILPLK